MPRDPRYDILFEPVQIGPVTSRNRIDPGEPAPGNAGAQLHPDIPFDPESAFEKCRHGQVLPDYFGRRYLDAYCSCKLNEYRAFVESDQAEAGWYL